MFSERESNFRFAISLKELEGTPSLTNGEQVFFRATIWPVALTLPLKTFPYDPSPIFSIRSYFSMSTLYQRQEISRIIEEWKWLDKANRRKIITDSTYCTIWIWFAHYRIFIELKILETKRHDSSHFVNVIEKRFFTIWFALNYFNPSLFEIIFFYTFKRE